MKIVPAIVAVALIGSMLLVGCRDSTPAPEPTLPPTLPPTATAQPVPSATPQSVPTQTPTPSPTPLPAPTATPVPTAIPTPAPLYLEGWRAVPGTGALEQAKRGLASVIISIPWVADGIDLRERASVGRLVNAAMLDEPVFLAVVDRGWVLDGLERTELTILQDLTRFRNEVVASRIAGLSFMDTVESADRTTIDLLSDLDVSVPGLLPAVVDKPWIADGLSSPEREVVNALWGITSVGDSVALRILDMPFLETVEPEDAAVVNSLRALASDGVEVVTAVIDNPWVEDGLDTLETDAIDWIGNFSDAEVAAAVAGFEWVWDGIEELEVEAIEELSYVNYYDTDIASAVMGLGWVQDGIAQTDAESIQQLRFITMDDVEVGAAIVDLGWVEDGIEELEFRALEQLRYINLDDAEVAASIVGLPWVEDGIDELDVSAIEELSYIANDDSNLASSVVEFTWMQDSINELELETISWIGNFSNPTVAASVTSLIWVQNGISPQRTRTIEELSYLSNKDAAQASRIVEMPFLEFLDPADVSAIESLTNLAWFRQDDFQRVLSHPTLSNGITDDWAKIVATLYGVSKNNPPLFDKLLDPNQVTLEERIIDLPLAGETHLAIIRTGPGAERSMDLLDHATRTIEAYMATPLPTNYVGLLFEDAVPGDSAGANFGTYVGALAKYDIDDGSSEADFAGSLIAHEVAHYYWSGNRSWVDEGIADFMGSLSENTRSDHPIEVTNSPCAYAPNILELEALDPEVGESTYTCNYALGERLFIDLYRSIGEEEFRRGLSNLYLISQTEDDGATRENIELGIDHVKAAFTGDEAVEMPIVNTIAARWYDGSEPYPMPEESTGLTNPILRTINGRVHTAYLSASHEGTPVTSISADAVDDYLWLLLRWDYEVGSDTEVPLDLVHYYEDGFEFGRRTVTFTADSRHNGSLWSWWLQVGQSPDNPWAVGNYGLHVYNEGRKLVELEYEVTE